jgi:hypothetical protein
MKEIIATEAIYSPLGIQVAVRFHYSDGSSCRIEKTANGRSNTVIEEKGNESKERAGKIR